MRRFWIVTAVVALLAGTDALLPVRQRPSTWLALGSIGVYQATVSPLFARSGVECRFTPTCSHYGEAVIRTWGVWRGGWLAARRVVRCGPWTPARTVDPPPVAARTDAALRP